MTNERETAEVIRTWMKEEVELNDAGIHRVLTRVPDTPQRRHRWLWPFDWRPFGSGATRSAEPHEATPTWRFRTMFTPIRVAAVTAVLALSGTLALVSGPLAPAQPVTAPGAESSVVSMAPAHFTGTVHAGGGSEVETETLPDRIIERYEVSYRNVMSDERLSGQGVGTNYDETIIGGDGAFYIVHASTGLLENEGGAWALTCDGVGDTGASSLAFIRCWYDGQAGYEGLTAFSILSSNDAGPIWDVTGWVFPGDQPLAP